MSQISATFVRVMKELLRDKVLIFWSVVFPIIWLLMASFVFLSSAPEDEAAPLKAAFTVSMITYAIIIAGIVDLPGNIASDRSRGMLSKLRSMPVKQLDDFLGRIFAFLVFSTIAIILVLIIGTLLGARFSMDMVSVLQSAAFIVLAILASCGIGLIIGTVIKGEQGAVYTGIAIALITSFAAGIFSLYSQLPSPLQFFSRIYPISSANSSLIFLLVGEDTAGYNPLLVGQLAYTIFSSLVLYIVGLAIYVKFSWRKE